MQCLHCELANISSFYLEYTYSWLNYISGLQGDQTKTFTEETMTHAAQTNQ